MKMYIDGLKIEGSETDFERLRINCEVCSRAFYELAKVHKNSGSLVNMGIDLNNKAQAIAERFEGVENDE